MSDCSGGKRNCALYSGFHAIFLVFQLEFPHFASENFCGLKGSYFEEVHHFHCGALEGEKL